MYGEPDVLVHRGLATKNPKAVSVRYVGVLEGARLQAIGLYTARFTSNAT